MPNRFIVFLVSISVLHVPTLCAQESLCRSRLEAAKKRVHHLGFLPQLQELVDKGEATNEKAESLENEWRAGKGEAISDLNEIYEDCRRQSKEAQDSSDGARLLGVAFQARVAWANSTPGNQASDVISDAVAAISAIDHHDQTGALLPFLSSLAMDEWDASPDESIHHMKRAVDIAGRVYGKDSLERAEMLSDFGYLFAPSTLIHNPNRHVDVLRAEPLFREALAIFDGHGEGLKSESYRTFLGRAKNFFRTVDPALAEELSEL